MRSSGKERFTLRDVPQLRRGIALAFASSEERPYNLQIRYYVHLQQALQGRQRHLRHPQKHEMMLTIAEKATITASITATLTPVLCSFHQLYPSSTDSLPPSSTSCV